MEDDIRGCQYNKFLKVYSNNMNSSTRHSKKDAKLEKIAKKQQSCIFYRKEIEQEIKNLQDDKSECQTQDPIIKRANKWWNKVDQRYFQSTNIDDVIAKRDFCTTNQILMVPSDDTTLTGGYRQEMIQPFLPGLTSNNKIRVMFKPKSPFQGYLATYSIEQGIANYHSENTDILDQSGIKVISKCHRSNSSSTSSTPLIPQVKAIRLDLQQYEYSESLCERVIKYSQIYSNPLHLHEVDKEIALWELELQRINQQNHINWNRLISNMQTKENDLIIKDKNQFDDQIMKHRDKLYWATVLRSFQHGFHDKTKKMLDIYIQNEKNHSLKPPKGTVNYHSKKMFQTDCKICFSSDNNDSNQVLYCDNCNTSFHLLCYGLNSIPEQDKYFCERCTYIRKQQSLTNNSRFKKPYCQICLKTAFPMKKLDDHFYHVTCLVLFNFVEFRDNQMVLKGSLTHENIMKMVIENQMAHEECNQCRKISGGTELGMQIRCCYSGCQNYAHPICAYLGGYRFELKSTLDKRLEVRMFCNDHLGSRVEQVYFRRYLCNLNDTSNKNYAEFKGFFQSEQKQLQSSKQTIQRNKKKYSNRVLMLTKFIKNYLKMRNSKGRQEEVIQTQTQSILRKLKSKVQSSTR